MRGTSVDIVEGLQPLRNRSQGTVEAGSSRGDRATASFEDISIAAIRSKFLYQLAHKGGARCRRQSSLQTLLHGAGRRPSEVHLRERSGGSAFCAIEPKFGL